MTDSVRLMPAIRTRLYRPPVTEDYIRRDNLESLLENGREYPIILVSAPAGYGKSTQISHWVGHTGTPYVWISLEKLHNDLGEFLRHLEVGVNDWSPATADLLHQMSHASILPPADQIANAISTNMDSVEEDLILVLDDYHHIHDADVHLLVESLLAHMPAALRIAIVTRRTPPLSIGRLRSLNLVLDIRLKDLAFDRDATRSLIENSTGVKIDMETLNNFERMTDGWPAGLRMLLLAVAGEKDLAASIAKFEGRVWQIQEYLVEEVIDQLPPNIANHIGRTAILDRFSADLCGALISGTEQDDISGQEIIDFIQGRDLFCIPLDESGEWFRYHHLFRELLLQSLRSQLSEVEIRQLHGQAAKWFDSKGRIEEAVQHYFRSEQSELAADVVIRHRAQLVEKNQWRRLDRILGKFPAEIIHNNLQFLTLLGWTCTRMGRVSQGLGAARRAKELLDNETGSGAVEDVTYGQFCALGALFEFFLGDGQATLAAAEKALALLPPHHAFERGEATMMRGIALQVLGSAVAGRDSLLEALEQPEGEVPFFQARILIGLCYLNWAEGALQEQKKSAKNLLELGQSRNDAHAVVHACWFSGAAHYHLNNLDAAANVVHLVAQDRWWPHHRSYLNCVLVMSLTHVARGEYSRALDLSESLVDQCLESRSTFHISEIYALQAGIAHARGDHETALRWALDFEPGPVTAAWGLLVPALIAARILLHSTQADAQEKAKEILDEHHSYFETTNTKQFLTETLALKAMLCAKSGDGEGADQFLSRAIDLAEHGGFIRIFVDLGPGIVPLLNRLELGEQQLKYVGTILAGFAGDSGNGSSGVVVESNRHDGAGVLEPLTKRENDVLELLAQRLTNKEIGERLFISPDTVKRHAHNVFAKLNVSTRREARAKAIGLGIVSD